MTTNTSPPVKIIFMSHSGAGKTCALASLANAGYKVRIIDLDNGIDALLNIMKERYKASIDNIAYKTITEPMTIEAGQIKPKKAEIWPGTLRLLQEWEGLGSPQKWGSDTVLVIDSLSRLGEGAFNYIQSLNGNLGRLQSASKGYDPRRDMWDGQQLVTKLMQFPLRRQL